MTSSATAAAPDSPGEIQPDTLYRLDEIKRRSGMGTWAFRMARRNGLKVIRTGGRAFVFGREFIRYMETVAERNGAATKAPNTGR